MIKNDYIFYISTFNFDMLYNKFTTEYSEDDFITVCHRFFEDFDYKFIDNLDYCKSIIKRNIKSLNKKGLKILRKIKGVVDRVEQDKNVIVENYGYFEQDINYDEYKKS